MSVTRHIARTRKLFNFQDMTPLLSGPKARPMSPSWVKDIRDQCLAAEVPFFFKQWGGLNKKKAGRVLDGRTWDDMPVVAGMESVSGVS